jgi:hypothetical protein
MASIHHEIIVNVPADQAWHRLSEVHKAHRLFADVLTDCELNENVRTVTFANGLVAREKIVEIDSSEKRVSYAVMDLFEHHNASMQIFAVGTDRCRFVWVTDLLPSDKASMVRPLVEEGSAALKKNLEEAITSAKTHG